MKRIIAFAFALPFAVYAAAAYSQDIEKKENVFDVPEITRKAEALPIEKCELNASGKDWTTPDGKRISLPVYRCVARDSFMSAVFTQIPDGSKQFPKEFVELCVFTNHTRSCEVVPIDRPASRLAHLKKFNVVPREFKETQCYMTSMMGEETQVCDEPSEKV